MKPPSVFDGAGIPPTGWSIADREKLLAAVPKLLKGDHDQVRLPAVTTDDAALLAAALEAHGWRATCSGESVTIFADRATPIQRLGS